MQPTWLEMFLERSDLNVYPSVPFRGGIGFKKPTGETVSTFVGHPVHYLDGRLWKPITLKPHSNGDFEGSQFSWRGKQVFHEGKTLFEPRAVIFNGVRHNLFLRQDGNRIVADLNLEGSSARYEIIINERGVREMFTVNEEVDGILEFDVQYAEKPEKLHKIDRHIIGGVVGDSFHLTPNMKYPIEVDPSYGADTADGYIAGFSATYATARSTANSHSNTGTTLLISHQLAAGDYYTQRAFPKFDTSGIDDGDDVTQVNMWLFVVDYSVGTHFNVQIIDTDWSSRDPIDASNREATFDAALTDPIDALWKNSASVAAGSGYDSANLSTSWVNKTGYTYYGVMNGNEINNVAPTANDQIMSFASQNYATSGDRPHLTVVHSPASSGRKNRMTTLGVG